ncbi:MAG TPA: MBL fold metallo-hydrolase [Stellaceae bacterium]|jgi:phosphoribosyl 1,2-cyclic phosphate phosphodiesterase|nr:MBL fold metallo-hydrolase [Stellaceae bacterium]
MRVTMLGSGPSWGVPKIGNDWGACDPANPKNRRTRCAILVEDGGGTILVDTPPDLRQQLLDAGASQIDAVLFTHAHADHSHGIDDLRSINRATGKPLPIYADPHSLAELKARFRYIFTPVDPGVRTAFYKPAVEPQEIAGPFTAAGMTIVPFVQDHGFSQTLGFRFGRFAYSTDVIRLDEAAFGALAGIDTWIVDCIRVREHVTHSHLAQTLDWIERVRPRRAILTHMDESLDYESLRRALPAGVEPGYDGLTIEV